MMRFRAQLGCVVAASLLLAGCQEGPAPGDGWLVQNASAAEGAGPMSSSEKPANASEPQVSGVQPDVPPEAVARRTDAEWRKILTMEQYRVTRKKGTEAPFTGKYWNTTADGVYRCACCGAPLFDAKSKFDAGCGWPSFSKAMVGENVKESPDRSHGMVRTEVTCKYCGAHLGHLFDDGPQPTGLRYCINSASLKLTPRAEKSDTKPTAASDADRVEK